MKAATMDQKPHHPLPSFNSIMKRRDGTKACSRTAKAEYLAESFFPETPNTDLGRVHWPDNSPRPCGIPNHRSRRDSKSYPQVSIPISSRNRQYLKAGFYLLYHVSTGYAAFTRDAALVISRLYHHSPSKAR